jgi:hypothetical protein
MVFEALAQITLSPMDKHICRHLHESVHGFNAVLREHRLEMGVTSYYKLLKQNLHTTNIPFEGSDKDALQVMGFLETRVLDFDELIVVSANENHLPAPNRHRSFIPYHLRKGFGLPTFEEQDAIYAYHFYRLLQRSKRVHILYNTGGDKQESEPSRFIQQLLQEHPALAGSGRSATPAQPVSWKGRRWPEGIISVPKTPEVCLCWQAGAFSPSALNTYLNCPLQFYLRYVAKLDEDDEVAETMDNRVMGIIIHKAMELYYLPWVGKEVIPADIEKWQTETALRPCSVRLLKKNWAKAHCR